ncbi:MAG TPA: hypothetical protein ENO22_12455 [candidate division Zixibacteria bacterium]|nr:hypothetical protein [candidate division Zixibacteria bacterium]HER00142.1 hypothetical protein [candidate division Zixibacteria bacterium]
MNLKSIILVLFISGLGISCSKSPTGPDDPLDRFIAGVSLGSDTLITNLTEPIVISFHLNMDRQSVEEAFSSEPAFDYDVHWTTFPICNPNDSTCYPKFYMFYIYPQEPFLPNTTYSCMIDSSAHDIIGDHLPRPYEFQFTTESSRLLRITPEYDGVDTLDAFPRAIKLWFNNSIDLSTIQEPFTASPSFDYELYGISDKKNVFEYRITSPLRSQSEYQIVIDAEIFDIHENRVLTEIDGGFSTGKLAIVYFYPNPGVNLKDTYPIIQVRFNTVMDRRTVQEAFSFNDGVIEIPGEFVWFTDKAMQYFPDSGLPEGETYTFSVSTGAADTYGATLDEAFSYSFTS